MPAYRALTIATLLGFAVTPAFAQLDPQTGARPGREPGVGQSYPLSPHASNIGTAGSGSTIAPTLPAPSVDADATPQQFLLYARQALAAGQTGRAQEAMERAQTRLLDRATPLFQTDRPSADPAVAQISTALRTLGAGDKAGAMREIETAIQMTR